MLSNVGSFAQSTTTTTTTTTDNNTIFIQREVKLGSCLVGPKVETEMSPKPTIKHKHGH